MCKSKIEGGWRCYSHTSKEYKKVLESISETDAQLDHDNRVMSEIKFHMEALDRQWEDGNIPDEDYNMESDRFIAYREEGVRRLAGLDAKKARLIIDAEKAKAEMQTTAKGLKELKAQIKEASTPEEKRELEVAYNVAHRINVQRKEAFVKYKENKAKAVVLREQANEKKREADSIVVSSPDHEKIKDDITIESHTLAAEAYLQEHGGNMEVQTLYSAKTGEAVPAKLMKTSYGWSWAILSDPKNPMSKPSGFITPPRGKTYESRKKFYENKGLVLGTSWVPGKVNVPEDEFGNRKVVVERTDGGFSRFCIHGNKDVYAEKIKKGAKPSQP